MNDGHIDQVVQEKAGEEPVQELVVTLRRNGTLSVAGPIGNKLLCYGMLDMAKDVVSNFRPKQPSPVIVPGIDPTKFRGNIS